MAEPHIIQGALAAVVQDSLGSSSASPEIALPEISRTMVEPQIMQGTMQGAVAAPVQEPGSSSALPEISRVRYPTPTQEPLLEQIAQCLRLSSPSYRYEDEPTNSVYVSVRPESESVSYIYSGGPSSSTEESCENAARKAVRDIMTKYRVTVLDLTHFRLKAMKRLAGLYSLKRLELDGLVKGKINVPLNEESPRSRSGTPKIVILDYVSLLKHLTEKFDIHCTTLLVLRHGRERFTAWVTVTLPGETYVKKDFVSACFKFPETAKNDVSKQVIEYVTPLFNIEVIDANYGTRATNRTAFKCSQERESFLALRERVLGVTEAFDPQYLLLEEEPTTPRGVMFQIPKPDAPPPPPKKMKLCATCEHKSHVKPARSRPPRYFKVSESVEAMCDRFKKA